MRSVSVADAKARLSELLAWIERGAEVVITRRGQPVARLSAVRGPKKPINFEVLDGLRARQPLARTRSVHLIRSMRDEKY